MSAAASRRTVRGSWLTSILGLVLLVGLVIVMTTGLLSNAAYDPRLDGNVALQGRGLSPLDFYLFTWPTGPSWLYALNQGIHVSLGLALIPVVIAKQWSVLPRPFQSLRVRSPARVLEQVSLVLLIGGIWFELLTGILFIEYWVPFQFDFTAAHYYGAWIFTGAMILHVGARLPRLRAGLRARREVLTLVPSPEIVAALGEPAAPSLATPGSVDVSRRLLLGSVALGSAVLGLQGAAQDIGGPVRRLAWMLPRSATLGDGPNGFPVNGTFASIGVKPRALTTWQLTLRGPEGQVKRLTRDELLAMEQHTYSLPIACREGWSSTQAWTGVRLRDLAAAVGAGGPVMVQQLSLDGAEAALAPNQVAADASLLALTVNGVALSPDHGFPARVIVPAEIAMNCLKWVHTLSFAPAQST